MTKPPPVAYALLTVAALVALLGAAPPPAQSEGAATEVTPTCRAAVLVYHHLGSLRPDASQAERNVTTAPAAFAAHMAILADEGHAVIRYSDLIRCMDGETTLPDRAVAITFDDGVMTQFTRALPVLEEHGFTATFFVVTDYVGGGPILMSWDNLRALEAKGMDVASHTRSHPWLTHMDAASLSDELTASKRRLETELGHPVEHLAYPFGAFDDGVRAAAAAAGYRSARSIRQGTDHGAADRYAVRIVGVTDSQNHFHRAVSR
jgi:peptidoglycan/xylan/chitin deacetylase (PgdA/CDA1 family)